MGDEDISDLYERINGVEQRLTLFDQSYDTNLCVVKDLQIMIRSNIGEVEKREPNRTNSCGLVGIEVFKINYSSHRKMFMKINNVKSRF